MAQRIAIDHFEPEAVIRGLLDGTDFDNRVTGSCIYTCPRCSHRIRFRWRSFHQADGRSPFKKKVRRCFDDLTPDLPADQQGMLEFLCPTCRAATRIIYSIKDYTKIAFHFDIYAVLVGEGKLPK